MTYFEVNEALYYFWNSWWKTVLWINFYTLFRWKNIEIVLGARIYQFVTLSMGVDVNRDAIYLKSKCKYQMQNTYLLFYLPKKAFLILFEIPFGMYFAFLISISKCTILYDAFSQHYQLNKKSWLSFL